MKKIIFISTKADDEFYLVFDKTEDKLIYNVSKSNDISVVENYYKSLSDVERVIVD